MVTKKIIKKIKKALTFERIISLLEIIILLIGSVILVMKANDISKMQLVVMKKNSQPSFSIIVNATEIEIPDIDSMVVSVENNGSVAENIEIEILPVVVVTYKQKNEKKYDIFKVIINDFYYGVTYNRKVGLIKSYHDNKSFKKYLDTYFAFLDDGEIDGYIEFNVLIRIKYIDMFDESQIVYYKINETTVNYLPIKQGEKEYKELSGLTNVINIKELNTTNIKKIIKNSIYSFRND